MSKRKIERGIEDLRETLLTGLSADERRTLTLNAEAEGNDRQVDLLQSSAPIGEYRLPDLEYALQMQGVRMLGFRAVHHLHWYLLEYERTRVRNDWRLRAWILYEEANPDTTADTDIDPSDQPSRWMRELVGLYRGLERFASEILGVSLETWLAPNPLGAAVVEDYGATHRLDEESDPDIDSDSDFEMISPEEISDAVYRTLTDTWTNTF